MSSYPQTHEKLKQYQEKPNKQTSTKLFSPTYCLLFLLLEKLTMMHVYTRVIYELKGPRQVLVALSFRTLLKTRWTDLSTLILCRSSCPRFPFSFGMSFRCLYKVGDFFHRPKNLNCSDYTCRRELPGKYKFAASAQEITSDAEAIIITRADVELAEACIDSSSLSRSCWTSFLQRCSRITWRGMLMNSWHCRCISSSLAVLMYAEVGID